jgi:hypothetical protein
VIKPYDTIVPPEDWVTLEWLITPTAHAERVDRESAEYRDGRVTVYCRHAAHAAYGWQSCPKCNPRLLGYPS